MTGFKKILIPLLFFSLVFIFFYNLQFTTANIPGYDGYYHIKMAEIIKTHGIIKKFPWLQTTHLKEHYVDHHFLYHLLLIPFTYFGLIEGAKLSAVFFPSLMLLAFYLFLKTFGIKFPIIWSFFLLSSSHPFLFRMCLPRAPAIALIFLFAGLYMTFKKKYFQIILLSFFFVWLYGGFTLMIFFAILAFAGSFLVKRDIGIKTVLFPLIGSTAGLIINPYFPFNIKFISIQTIQAGLSRTVTGGGEWLSYNFLQLARDNSFLLIIFIFSLILLKGSKNKMSYETITFLLISISLLFLTLKSRRFIEFFVPFAVGTSAFLIRDEKLNFFLNVYKSRIKKPLLFFIMVSLLIIAGKLNFDLTKKELLSDQRPVDRYKGAALWLETHTPGSTVYTTDWDDFPELFFYNSKNRYLVGLDPAFMYLYDEKLFREWNLINSGQINGNLYDIILQDFKAPFLFTDSAHKEFIRAADKSPYLQLEYADPYCRVYALVKSRSGKKGNIL